MIIIYQKHYYNTPRMLNCTLCLGKLYSQLCLNEAVFKIRSLQCNSEGQKMS